MLSKCKVLRQRSEILTTREESQNENEKSKVHKAHQNK